MPNSNVKRMPHPLLLRGVAFPAVAASGIAGLLSVLALSSIWGTVVLLWALWTTDALKSIGIIVPVISFLLIMRVWRSIGWSMDGTWWGFALLVAIAVLVRVRERAVMMVVLSPHWTIFFPPHSLVMLAFGVGLVLLFGGMRLLRASLFPLLLLLLVNPVPHIFNVYIDLPLQRASAHVARAFAISLGQPLSSDKLRLMFTPEFGMFIAPGCNGIRGAVTMGFIALVAGYLYRFPWRWHAAVVMGAVALGYVFNFVRLCVLVLYYLVALHFPDLQDRAENADYVIGGILFLIAVFLLYSLIQRLGAAHADHVLTLPQVAEPAETVPRSFFARAGALTVLVVLGLVGVAQGFGTGNLPSELAAEERAQGQFPGSSGAFHLVRTWNEDLMSGTLLFHWAEYAPVDGGPHISIGVSPVLGAHDTMICHAARGEEPLWHGQQDFGTAGGREVNFNGSFFNDGATQYLEATTICNQSGCGEYSSAGTHLGFVISRTDARSFLSQSAARPIPILLKAETIDTTLPAAVARTQLTAQMSAFLSHFDVHGLTTQYRAE